MKKFQERISGLRGSVGTLSAILLLFFSPLSFFLILPAAFWIVIYLYASFFLWASFLLYASNFFFSLCPVCMRVILRYHFFYTMAL